jgi:hypothetical protein
MSTTELKQKIHSYLEVADDKKVKAIYTILEHEIEESGVEYTEEFKTELNRRFAAYKDGSEPPFTAAESKKRIQKLLKAARK